MVERLGVLERPCVAERPGLTVSPTRPPYPADGDNPATASASSIPIGMIIGAGTVIPLST